MTLAELDRFLHQLVDDLTTMRGWAQLALRELPPGTDQQEYLERLLQTVIQMAHRIQEQRRDARRDDPMTGDTCNG